MSKSWPWSSFSSLSSSSSSSLSSSSSSSLSSSSSSSLSSSLSSNLKLSYVAGSSSTRSYWATDDNRKWTLSLFNLSSHCHIYIIKYIILLAETICSENWGRSLFWCAKSAPPVSVRDPKTSHAEALYCISDALIIVVNVIIVVTIIVINVIAIIIIILVVIIFVVIVVVIMIIIIQKCT